MVKKASSISPHILCNNKVIKVIGIQRLFYSAQSYYRRLSLFDFKIIACRNCTSSMFHSCKEGKTRGRKACFLKVKEKCSSKSFFDCF